MKFRIFVFCICLIFTNSFAIYQPYYVKKHFGCFSYDITIHENIRIPLAGIENNIEINAEGKQSRTEALFYHNIYRVTTKYLEDSLEIFILPSNSLTNKAKYNLYGYPDITIQKAIRLSDIRFFFKILVNVNNDLFDDDGKRYPEGTFKPQIKVNIELYSKDGFDPIHVAEGFSEAKAPVQLNSGFIAGMEFVNESIKVKQGSIALKSLIDEAVLNAVMTLKNTKPKRR